MKLVAGLGNPGDEYAQTRHNAGFMVLHRLADRYGRLHWKADHNSLLATLGTGESRILLLKPMTFMNLSGTAIQAVMRFYGLSIDDLLVVVDDIALPCGTLRLRPAGSSGGHNGLASVERSLASVAAQTGKSGRDYARLRIGIDGPGRIPMDQYVLGRFSADQQSLLEPALNQAADAVQCWADFGLTAAMNRFNGPAAD